MTTTTRPTRTVGNFQRLGLGAVVRAGSRKRDGALEFVMNGSAPDRGGDVVHHSGADLTNFLENPVMPWGHDYNALPLGTWENVRVERGHLVGLGVFSAREVYPFAETVFQMYDRGILRACSIGFRPIKWAWSTDRGDGAIDFLTYSLLECSAVMIGQHQDALAFGHAVKSAGLDLAPFYLEAERCLEVGGWLPRDEARRVLAERPRKVTVDLGAGLRTATTGTGLAAEVAVLKTLVGRWADAEARGEAVDPDQFEALAGESLAGLSAALSRGRILAVREALCATTGALIFDDEP